MENFAKQMDYRHWNRIIKGKSTIYEAIRDKKNFALPGIEEKMCTVDYLLGVLKGDFLQVLKAPEVTSYDKRATLVDIYSAILEKANKDPGYPITNLPNKAFLLKTLKQVDSDNPIFHTEIEIIKRTIPDELFQILDVPKLALEPGQGRFFKKSKSEIEKAKLRTAMRRVNTQTSKMKLISKIREKEEEALKRAQAHLEKVSPEKKGKMEVLSAQGKKPAHEPPPKQALSLMHNRG